MYKAIDGQLFELASACDKHNAEISVLPAIQTSLRANCVATDEGLFTAEDVCAWIYKSAPEMVGLLAPLIPKKPRVPRKPKSEAKAGEKTAKTPATTQDGMEPVVVLKDAATA